MEFFEKLVIQQKQKTLKHLLEDYEKLTRIFVSEIMSESLNIVINFNQLKFDEGKINKIIMSSPELQPEQNAQMNTQEILEFKIVKFLEEFLDYMNNEVPKHWQYFSQYFEFWRNFAKGG